MYPSHLLVAIQAAQNVGGYATTAPCSTSATGSINCNEGNLDIQYIMGLAQSTVSVYWFVADCLAEFAFELYIWL